jgi:hypothetical protein
MWLREQLRLSVIPLLRRRLERVIEVLGSQGVLRWAVQIALCVYLLPAFLIGLLLLGVSVVISSLAGVRGLPTPARLTPLGIALFLLKFLVPRPYRDAFITDLIDEHERIRQEIGDTEANRWLWKQIGSSILPLLRRRLKRLLETLHSEEFAVRAVQIALCVYLLPALLAVVLVSVVGIIICFLVDIISRFPPSRWLLQGLAMMIRSLVNAVKRFGRWLGSEKFAGRLIRLSSVVSVAIERHGGQLSLAREVIF